MRRRVLLSVVMPAAVVVGALGASGCGGGSGGQRSQPSSTAQQRIERVRMAGGLWGYPSPFAISQMGPAQAALNLAFDSLVWLNPKGEVIPWLATTWKASADGKEWRMTLRTDAKWQDGQPLTADDVVFTFQYSATGPGKTGSLSYNSYANSGVTDVRAESPSVVVFRTADVNATFLARVAAVVPVVPKHVWAAVADPLKYRDASALIGSGPYRIQSFDETAGAYQFVANDSYWRGVPYVKRVEMVPAPDEFLALKRGDIDVANLSSSTVADSVLKAMDQVRYGTISANGQSDILIMFGMTRGFPYNQVAFRQALAYAMDRKDMVDRVLLGRGTVSSMGMIEPPDSQWVPKDLPNYDYNTTKAAALLDQVGLKLGSDGVRHLPNGGVFKPTMLVSNQLSATTAQVVQEYLRGVGIQVDIKTVDRPTLNAATTKGNYDLALFSYGISWDPTIARDNLSSRAPDTWWKVQGWNNTRFDDLMDLQNTQLDVKQRIATTHALEEIVANEVPILPLVTPSRMAMLDKTVLSTWYYTTGGGPIYPFLINKLVFVSQKVGS